MSGGSSIPQAYKPTGQASADQGYQNVTSTLAPYASSIPSYVLPQLQNLTNAQVNNPYAGQAQSGANAAGAYATGTVAPMQYGAAQSLYGTANAATPYATQALATANDPQNALYARNYQQQMDQQNAINAQNGIAGTPYGAGVAGQTANNFNLDWLNNQLTRQGQGANTYAALTGAQQGLYTGASNLGNAGLQTSVYGSALPYATYGGNAATGASALNNYSSGAANAFAPATSLAGLYSNYLGLGQNAASINQNAAQLNNQENSSIFGGLGNLIGYGTSLFGF
jgi:hypothetical protein